MAFLNCSVEEARGLEVPVNVASEDRHALQACLTPSLKDLKTRVRLDSAVHGQTMAVKPPREPRCRSKRTRAGDFLETQSLLPERRVSSPEPFCATEVR